MKLCLNCRTSRVHAKGRCKTCHQFLRRNGYERSEEHIVRANKHAFERRLFRRRMAQSA